MFFEKENQEYSKSKEKVNWKKKFAILPVSIYVDSNGTEKYVWLGWYETRKYYEKSQRGWFIETRIPNSTEIKKVPYQDYYY